MQRFIAAVSACCLLVVGTVKAAQASPDSTFRQPAEFEPQAGVWLTADPDNPEFLKVTAAMANALLPHVRVRLLDSDDKSLAKSKAALQQHGVPVEQMEFHTDPLATYFIRDGAVYLTDDHGSMSVLDLKWSDYGLPGWCRRLYPNEPERAAKCTAYLNTAQDGIERVFARIAGCSVIYSPLFLENATFEVNGRGVLLISEPLALQRNPGMTRADIERELRVIPGVKKVIWLGEGVAQDPLGLATIQGNHVGWGAGGHTDEFVRFTDPHTILLAWHDDEAAPAHPLHRINRDRMQKNFDILTRATDQDGQPFRVIKVPMPTVIERPATLGSRDKQTDAWNEASFPASEGRKAGDQVIRVAAATYLNFIIANKVVLVPSFVEDGTPLETEARVREILEEALPGRLIVFIRATPLTWNGGGLHCATLSEPSTGKAGGLKQTNSR